MALQQETYELWAAYWYMGAISRSRMSEELIGGTAEKVLDFLRTYVLIIKSNQAQEANLYID